MTNNYYSIQQLELKGDGAGARPVRLLVDLARTILAGSNIVSLLQYVCHVGHLFDFKLRPNSFYTVV